MVRADAAVPRRSDDADWFRLLLILCGLLAVIGLVIALVLLVLFIATAALVLWGAIALIRWFRQRRRSAVAASAPTSALVDADEVGLVTHVQVLATFPAELRATFDRMPVQHAAPVAPAPPPA